MNSWLRAPSFALMSLSVQNRLGLARINGRYNQMTCIKEVQRQAIKTLKE